ncbi:hypothetical protein [Actinoplanes sp. URMC 104]|uniref:hypothetical protein n=1 Tax=Actinoplanes sp. URMC 104 TaxID=3423409 RepID=UPI003F1E1F85
MRYGTPPPAHRATADGGLMLLVRGIGPGGQHRLPPAPQPRARTRGRRRAAPARVVVEPRRAAQWMTQGLAGLILLGLALMIGFLVLASDRHQRESATTAAPAGELFPQGGELRPAGATGAYRVDTRQSGADCRVAATGQLGAVLAAHGCRGVVRAGLTSPYEGYRVTAGAFSLGDEAAAREVDDLVRGLVETGDGGFTTLPAGAGGDPATARVGWHARGDRLLYCVITRPDGSVMRGDDPYPERITAELVDAHLGGAASEL